MRRLVRLVSGRGKPRDETLWQKQYAAGEWERLKQLDELAHYSVIVGYLSFLKPGGAFLDVGCGEGILQARLGPGAYSRYVGIDLSETAIQRASARSDEKTLFVRCEADAFASGEKFDAVIFNEVLYYCDDPLGTLRHLRGNLRDDGVYVVSMIASLRSFFLWRRLGGHYRTLDVTEVVNRPGDRWLCKILRPGD
jgi:2-polyprenyl-3-methyl-5-hydroxy-6-metoxy-1,4-benzoquinol methylase